MEWVTALQEAVNYMEKHLLEDINYINVAKSVCMSSYNFHKVFSLMAGMSANEYIRNRRLSLAGQELQMMNQSVIDVALKYGYESPDSFARAFAKFHGVTPQKAKSCGTQLRLFNPLVIKISFEGGTTMEYRIERKASQRFMVLARTFEYDKNSEGCDHKVADFWIECHDHNLVEPIRNLRPQGSRDLYGINSPDMANQNSYEYGIGVILDQNTDTSKLDELCEQGFTIWETEPTDYTVLRCYGDNGDCIKQMWEKFFKEFLPQTNYKYLGGKDYEIYYENSEDGLFCEVWIPVMNASLDRSK